MIVRTLPLSLMTLFVAIGMSCLAALEAQNAYITETIKAPTQPVPYDADLFKKDEQVFSSHLEFLYWVAEEGSLDYALKMTGPSWGSSNSYAQGDFHDGTFNIEPGFRLGFSFFRAPKYWEIKWQYTRLTDRGDNSVSQPAGIGEYLTGTWPQVLANPLASATSSLHLNYNVADMSIARVFIPNPHLRIKLLTDLSIAWINQSWRVHYIDTSNAQNKISSHWGFTGAGMGTGALMDWFWSSDMYVTGAVTATLYMGQYKNHAYQNTTYNESGTDNTGIPVRNAHYTDVRAVFSPRVLLGPSWQKNFSSVRCEIFAGYELTAWFNLQEVFHSTAASASQAKETWKNTSVLALQGLTARFSIDY